MTRSTTTAPLLIALLILGACQASLGVTTGDSVPAVEAETTDAAPDSARDAGAKAAPPQDSKKAKPKAKKSKGPTLKELQAQLTKAQEARTEARRQERYAASELEIAALDESATEIEVVESLRAARAKLGSSRSAMERFDEVERPLEVRESELKVTQADEQLVVEEENLLGILALYAEETEARSMEEIIRRHRKRVETARERVAIANQKRAALVDHTLPSRMREKAEAVRVAEAGLAKAEAAATKTRRKTELALEKAADEATDAKRDAKKASKSVDSARRKVNDKREAQVPKTKKTVDDAQVVDEAPAKSDG